MKLAGAIIWHFILAAFYPSYDTYLLYRAIVINLYLLILKSDSEYLADSYDTFVRELQEQVWNSDLSETLIRQLNLLKYYAPTSPNRLQQFCKVLQIIEQNYITTKLCSDKDKFILWYHDKAVEYRDLYNAQLSDDKNIKNAHIAVLQVYFQKVLSHAEQELPSNLLKPRVI